MFPGRLLALTPVTRGMKLGLLECSRLADVEERPIPLESAREE